MRVSSWVMPAACLWVFAATATAMLPMRLQYVPGLMLLILAPVLLYLIAVTYGVVLTLFAVFAVLSMYRRPLLYYARKITGASRE